MSRLAVDLIECSWVPLNCWSNNLDHALWIIDYESYFGSYNYASNRLLIAFVGLIYRLPICWLQSTPMLSSIRQLQVLYICPQVPQSDQRGELDTFLGASILAVWIGNKTVSSEIQHRWDSHNNRKFSYNCMTKFFTIVQTISSKMVANLWSNSKISKRRWIFTGANIGNPGF